MFKLLLGFLAGWLLRPFVSVNRRFGKLRVAWDKRRLKLAKGRARRLARSGRRGGTLLSRLTAGGGSEKGKAKKGKAGNEKPKRGLPVFGKQSCNQTSSKGKEKKRKRGV